MSAPRSRWLSLALVASCLVVQAACCWAEGTTMQYRLVIGTPERPQELGMDILPVKCKLEKAGDATIEPVAILKLPAFRSGVAKLRCSLAPSARLREVTAGLPVEDEPESAIQLHFETPLVPDTEYALDIAGGFDFQHKIDEKTNADGTKSGVFATIVVSVAEGAPQRFRTIPSDPARWLFDCGVAADGAIDVDIRSPWGPTTRNWGDIVDSAFRLQGHIDWALEDQPSDDESSRNTITAKYEWFMAGTPTLDQWGTPTHMDAKGWTLSFESDQKFETLALSAGFEWRPFPRLDDDFLGGALAVGAAAEYSQTLKAPDADDEGGEGRLKAFLEWDRALGAGWSLGCDAEGWWTFGDGESRIRPHAVATLSRDLAEQTKLFVRYTGGSEPPAYTPHNEFSVGVEVNGVALWK